MKSNAMIQLAFGIAISLVCTDQTTAQAPSAALQAPVPATQPKADKPKVYDEKADAKQQISAAVAKAKKENQRVLLQWGGNWCGWCILLDECMKKDEAIRRLVQYEYVVVHIDAGVPNDKNMNLAKVYGADPKTHGFPYLTVLDADGKAIANQDTGSLEVPGEMKHDHAKVLEFLKKHTSTPADAKAAVEAALMDAKKSDRMVFMHFGAPWCVWCHRLEDWMARPEVAELFSREFVDLKIDIDRMAGGKEVHSKYRGDTSGGIPWFAFVDAEGKVVMTSDGPQGNVGFPAAAEEIAHFESMLAKTAKKLTKQEQSRLVDSLKGKSAPATSTPAHGG
jgi:uncharacterized protein YyaL (SSP411 family)